MEAKAIYFQATQVSVLEGEMTNFTLKRKAIMVMGDGPVQVQKTV
jgi:hypothetical protein